MQRSQIFKYIYSNIHTIFNTNIYLDIRLCQIFYTNIFGHLFVYLFMQIYSEICLCQSSYKCHTLIQMSHSHSSSLSKSIIWPRWRYTTHQQFSASKKNWLSSASFLLWNKWVFSALEKLASLSHFHTFKLSHFHTFWHSGEPEKLASLRLVASRLLSSFPGAYNTIS